MTDLRKAATEVTPQVTQQVTPEVKWVGLTDDDFYGQSESQVMAMKYAEAKLKEKNT
jgi:hypothetical protein